MADIVGIGSSVFDFIVILDHWPEEDTKFMAPESKIQCGGPTAVGLIAATKLGVSTAFLAKLGDDIFGRTIREKMTGYGVDISHVIDVPGGTSPSCIVLSNRSNSKRTCIGGSSGREEAVRLRPEDIDLALLREAKLLHVDGKNSEASIYAAEKIHEFGGKVLYDADGVREGEELFYRLMSLADYLIPSEATACMVAGTDDPEEAAWNLYRRFSPEVLVVTLGPQGGVMIVDGKLTRYAAFSVNAIDSNGAGDVFHGAWAAATVMGMDPYEATRFASATSALKCTRFGAADGTPTYDELAAFLAERPDEGHVPRG